MKDISDLDLIYSDSSHGPQTAGAHQQVVYIDHGGGAVSQIRRTSFIPNPSLPSVPSLPFRPHVNHYPNSPYEPYVNFPEDIPRIFERRFGQTTPSPIDVQPQPHPPHLFPPHDPRLQPIPQPLPHPMPQPMPQPVPQPMPQPIPHPLHQPLPQFPQHLQYPVPQPLQHPALQPIPQPIAQPNPHPMIQPIRQPIEPDLEDERFLINNEIERIPKPSNQMKPAQREPPVQEPPLNGFFNFADPGLFQNFDSPFDPFSQNEPLFQRRRLTTNNNINNNGQELNPNSIGYPSYTYIKGGGDDNPSLTNWPKIFKFTDGRSNLYEFEKQKKMNKIKFNSKETYFDHISRDSFLILHGGTFAQ